MTAVSVASAPREEIRQVAHSHSHATHTHTAFREREEGEGDVVRGPPRLSLFLPRVDRDRLSGRICERVTFCHALDMWE